MFTPAAKLAPAQKHTFTRSDRVRAEWNDFEQTWVLPHQAEIEKDLQELTKAAERTSRAKDKSGTPNGMDKIIKAMQREFALAARAEWDARLQRANLQAEEWVDMTPEEMLTVEEVLSYESDEDTGVYAQAQRVSVAGSANSSSTAIGGSTPPAAPKPLGCWQSRSSAPVQPSAAQKAKAGQPLHSTPPVASRSVPADVPEPLKVLARFHMGWAVVNQYVPIDRSRHPQVCHPLRITVPRQRPPSHRLPLPPQDLPLRQRPPRRIWCFSPMLFPSLSLPPLFPHPTQPMQTTCKWWRSCT